MLYNLISNSNDGIGIFDIDKEKYIFINKAIEEITGYPAESFYKNSNIFYDICHESDRRNRKTYGKEKSWPPISKFKIIRKDGTIRICEDKIQKNKILDKNCALFILSDITEKEKVAEITTLFRLTINTMSNGFSLRDLHADQYFYLNPAIGKITGYPVEKFYKGGLEFWINNVVYKNDQHKMSLYLKTKNWPERLEYRIVKPDGEIRWIEALLSQTKYKDKFCIATINGDITDKKHSEEIHKLLDIHLETISTAVVICNDNRVIYANQGLADLHGYPLEKLKKGYFDFRIETCVHPDDREMEKNVQEYLIKEKKWPTIREGRIIKPDGTIHWIRANISPLEYFGEKCYAIFMKDITKEKEESQLKQIIADVELVSEGLVIVGIEKGNYLYLNQSRERIYGYPLDVFYKNGSSFWFNTCLHPNDRDKELAFADKKNWPKKRSFRIIRPNGEIRHLEVRDAFSSLITYKGQPCRVMIEIDVTDSVKKDNEIARLKKELSELKSRESKE